MATKSPLQDPVVDPMIDPITGEYAVIAPGHTLHYRCTMFRATRTLRLMSHEVFAVEAH